MPHALLTPPLHLQAASTGQPFGRRRPRWAPLTPAAAGDTLVLHRSLDNLASPCRPTLPSAPKPVFGTSQRSAPVAPPPDGILASERLAGRRAAANSSPLWGGRGRGEHGELANWDHVRSTLAHHETLLGRGGGVLQLYKRVRSAACPLTRHTMYASRNRMTHQLWFVVV